MNLIYDYLFDKPNPVLYYLVNSLPVRPYLYFGKYATEKKAMFIQSLEDGDFEDDFGESKGLFISTTWFEDEGMVYVHDDLVPYT